KLDMKIILEPGRFIAGNSGILVTSVVYVKETPAKKFIIVDAGMNDLIRPSFYEAYHKIQPVNRNKNRRVCAVDVVGPVCESGDYFARNRKMPELKTGALLAIMSAGAYGFSMASNYNARRRPSEVMVIDNGFYVVREREDYKDLIRGENIPGVLK
ncbi:MAG: diaminopimelate decarboxylase, partial [Candidatus Omnitrophota bacterium]|nr:diaminopimelate decarboxylase [Candidatus Omnitrophota bacterium]